MLRILTSLIRNAPGPFKGARALAADLVEGLVDVVSPPPEVVPPPPPPPAAPVEPEPSRQAAGAPPPAPVPQPKPAETPKADATPKGKDVGKAFKKAIGRADWVRRQDFKVLAIFWEARRRGMGRLTAKKAASLGSELGLVIRHENVRKVVRTRLADSIETTTVPDSQPPTFEYELTADGAARFEQEYLAAL